MPRAKNAGVELERVSIAGARHLRPYSQGDFDGLCALYAVLNSLNLVTARAAPLSYAQCETLFKSGVDFLAGEGRLPLAVRWGITQLTWPRLTNHLIDRLLETTNTKVLALRPFARHGSAPIDAVLDTIEATLARQSPIATLLRGPYSHYVCISGFTPSRLLLYDSYGFQWLAKSSCVVGADKRGRHRIIPATLTTFELAGFGEATR